MSDHAQTAQPPVDPDALQKAIQKKLNDHRQEPPHAHITVDRPVFAEGVWRSIVHNDEKNSSAVGYATVLAEVEEELFDDFGVNVALVLASD